MQRVKSFESTGIAPNGRLYASDLNLIQDAAAGKSDFTQTVDLAVLTVGDPTLQLLRYGPSEARITGSLRTDGIVRALGGFIAGAFNEGQKAAIPAGQAPYGTIILNSELNQYEFNAGTDAARVWLPFINTQVQSEVVGAIKMWPTLAAPTGYLLCDGSAVSRATYFNLNSLFGAASYPYGAGDGSTTFNLPDFRGRVAVGVGTHGDVDQLAENEGAALGDRRPKHKHTVNDPGHTHVYTNPGSSLGTGGAGGVSGPNNNQPTTAAVTGVTVGPQANSPVDGPAFQTINFIIKT